MLGGQIAGHITNWENLLLLAFFYAFSGALGMFCVKLVGSDRTDTAVRSATAWAIAAFLLALPMTALPLWLATRLLG